MDKQTFGTFVAEQRKRQGLTQRQLAQLLHVTDKAVSKWERGLSYPDVTLLQPLAATLSLDTDRLLTCRREESEEHMTQITPPLPPAEASPAVQAVLDISDANSRLRRKRQRLAAAAAVLAIAVIAVLAAMQYNGALFISRRIVTPDGVTMSLYRDALIGGRFRMETDAPLSMADEPCSFCGQSEPHDVTRLALDGRLTALDPPPMVGRRAVSAAQRQDKRRFSMAGGLGFRTGHRGHRHHAVRCRRRHPFAAIGPPGRKRPRCPSAAGAARRIGTHLHALRRPVRPPLAGGRTTGAVLRLRRHGRRPPQRYTGV